MLKKETDRKRQNPNNPNNSTLIQCLYELLQQETIDDELREQIKNLKATLDKKPDIVRKADEAVNYKAYADNTLSFYKVGRYEQSAGLRKLITSEQYYVLSALAKIMSQDNLVRLSINDLMIITGMGERTIQRHLQSLTKCGCIAIHTPAQPKRGIPRTYMVNPLIFDCGKSSPAKDRKFWSLSNCERKEFVNTLTITDYCNGVATIPATHEKIGTLEYINPNKKSDCVTGK